MDMFEIDLSIVAAASRGRLAVRLQRYSCARKLVSL
jgi:hypothetical protein